jgi:nitrite reductase/ring-hydroxylating ferredoxin subunit
MTEPPVGATQAERGPWSWGITEMLLAAVLALTGATIVGAMGLYVLPRDAPDVTETQPAVRVARAADFPAGASRLVRWGDKAILVVRAEDSRYFAVAGVAPGDGCVLDWDDRARRIVSPCSYVVYDLRGNVVTGLSTAPLTRYNVFTRDGVVYVSRL